MNRKVKAIMMLAGIRNIDIAKKANVSNTWVSLVLNKRKKSDRIRKVIADEVGMSVDELWAEDNKAA